MHEDALGTCVIPQGKSVTPDDKNISYRVLHHASKAHYGLQTADYCNWATFRKWEQADDEYYQVISSALKSEYDIFKEGNDIWY